MGREYEDGTYLPALECRGVQRARGLASRPPNAMIAWNWAKHFSIRRRARQALRHSILCFLEMRFNSTSATVMDPKYVPENCPKQTRVGFRHAVCVNLLHLSLAITFSLFLDRLPRSLV
jgi:hypothetical protein